MLDYVKYLISEIKYVKNGEKKILPDSCVSATIALNTRSSPKPSRRKSLRKYDKNDLFSWYSVYSAI